MEFEAEGLGGLEVDHELKLGGLDHRQIGGLLALQNPRCVEPGLPIGVRNAGPITHQATRYDGLTPNIACGERMASRQRDDSLLLREQERAGTNKQRPGPAMHERGERRLSFPLVDL